MNLYVESSAVLAWLLDEATAPAVRRLLGEAEVIVASDLTLIDVIAYYSGRWRSRN